MSMNTDPDSLEAILAKLAKDVENAVHAMYRRQAGPNTTQVRAERFVLEARDRIAGSANARVAAPSGALPRFTGAAVAGAVGSTVGSTGESTGEAAGWTADEAAAVTKCIRAWLPMGAPSSAAPESRCVAPGRELIPLWRERELARQAAGRVQAR